MTWNWQHADWRHFVWDAHRLRAVEAVFLQGAGVALGVAKHLAASDHQQISVEILSGEAVGTSAIEGEILDRGSVQSSI